MKEKFLQLMRFKPKVYLVFGLSFLNAATYGLTVFVLVFLWLQAGASYFTIGIFGSLYWVAQASSLLFFGRVSDEIGRKPEGNFSPLSHRRSSLPSCRSHLPLVME